MTAVRLAWLELRRFRGPLPRLVPVILALIPLLYGGTYLWANWNPYGRTGAIPVAVVNQDRPVVVRGQHVSAGADFVAQLRHDHTFDWRFVDADAAHRGLVDGRYAFEVRVPPDFSARLASPAGTAPARASLDVTLNDANGYIVGKIAETTELALQDQIDAAAHTAYAQAILGNLTTLHQRLAVAAAGAHELANGAGQLSTGATSLLGGLRDLDGGAASLSAGADRVASGTGRLANGVDTVANAVNSELPTLQAAANTLVQDATTASQHLGSAAANADAVASALRSNLASLAAIPGVATSPAYAELQTLAAKASAAAGNVRDVATSIVDQASTARGALASVGTRLEAARQAATTGVSDIDQLASGAQAVAAGASALHAGLGRAVGGATTLQGGARRVAAGATSLASGLDTAAAAVPSLDPAERARAASVLGQPVSLRQTNLHPAGVYGRGLAPFFFAIALWVFGLIAFLLLNPFNNRALAGDTRATAIALGGWLPAAVIGATGGLVLYLVVDFGLGLDPLHPLWTIGVVLLAAVVFVAIDQFLNTALGVVGDILSLVLLMLQLTSCGGLYPVVTTPAFFQALHPLLPMSYLVSALRITISGGYGPYLVRDVLVLAGVGILALAGTTLVAMRHRGWTMARLKPAVEL